MRSALVFGGSGQIGMPLLLRLQGAGWRMTAVSRQLRTQPREMQWLQGDFAAMPALPDRFDTIFSLGPLDRFSQWYAASDVACARVIAFGSTSLETKQDSSDEGERAIVARLREGEARVFETARQRGAQATVLRPTLVYGAGRDQTLSRIVGLARRTGFFVLPRNATGLRQPVHVEDLAEAALRVVDADATHGGSYALGGGETLTYRRMVQRTLAALQPPARLIELPSPLFALLLRAARAGGRLQGLNDAAVARMREDLVFDIEPARRDFGYTPRAFQPEADMFPPP